MKKFSFKSGPAIIITAAFIGPGSLTVCAIAGAEFGFELLWGVLISCLITIFIQNSVARLSFFSGMGLLENLNIKTSNTFIKLIIITLVLFAVFIGNAAYEAGNISGAYLGLEGILKNLFNKNFAVSKNLILFLIGFFVIISIWNKKNNFLKNILRVAVLVMSISFVFSAILTSPSVSEIASSLLIPRWRPETWKTIIALIGTTIVPYNLFLHAALVKNLKRNKINFLSLKHDTIIAVSFGGIISIAIIVSAAGAKINNIESIIDLGNALSNLYGPFSQIFISIGLFSAGLSSAITAPMAAGFVVEECFGNYYNKSFLNKLAVVIVVFAGVFFSTTNINPIVLIKTAQITNGLLLPIVIFFLTILFFPKKTDRLINKLNYFLLFSLFIFFAFLSIRVMYLYYF
ncbi:MAG: manganese transporter [Flavobacteriaceae bacterium]|nr:manganese transporter [Flavobacteriaceae bacterium]|tara:strand:+ start:13048 stop:14256 length:1209 start_codon:yes stop_codon:yes gene_type:complete